MRPRAPWRDLPVVLGPWQTTYDQFRGRTHKGLWAPILGGLSASMRNEQALMENCTAMRVHAHGANHANKQLAQAMGRSRSSLSTKIHMACDALGYPLGFVLTSANVSNFDQARPLLKIHLHTAALVIIDKGNDSDAIRAYVNPLGGLAVIPPETNRAAKPAFAGHFYSANHRIENLFAKLKSSAASPPATTNSSSPSPLSSPVFAAFSSSTTKFIWQTRHNTTAIRLIGSFGALCFPG